MSNHRNLRGDETTNPDGFLDGEDSVSRRCRRDGVTIVPWGFLGEPFEEAGSVRDLALCIGERLAIFPCNKRCQIVRIVRHQLPPFSQHPSPFSACCLSKFGPRFCGDLYGIIRLFLGELGTGTDDLSAGGIYHSCQSAACLSATRLDQLTSDLEGFARLGLDPFSIDVAFLLEERGVFELESVSSAATLKCIGLLLALCTFGTS